MRVNVRTTSILSDLWGNPVVKYTYLTSTKRYKESFTDYIRNDVIPRLRVFLSLLLSHSHPPLSLSLTHTLTRSLSLFFFFFLNTFLLLFGITPFAFVSTVIYIYKDDIYITLCNTYIFVLTLSLFLTLTFTLSLPPYLSLSFFQYNEHLAIL